MAALGLVAIGFVAGAMLVFIHGSRVVEAAKRDTELLVNGVEARVSALILHAKAAADAEIKKI